jgi:hypothetical protein
VAVEASPEAVIHLQAQYPGLKILEEPLEELLRSTGDLTWPEGEVKQYFRAQVVNVDLDAPLEARIQSDQLVFPALKLIRKLAVLHAEDPHIDWTLCLTLRAGFEWSGRADASACQLLAENFTREPAFRRQAQDLLGSGVYEDIAVRPTKAEVRNRDASVQQRVLMALVPKKIAYDAHTLGWLVETQENLRYGNDPYLMVTWVLRFTWDERGQTMPDDLYRDGLARVLSRRGNIEADGTLLRDPQPDPEYGGPERGSDSARI